MAASDEDQPLKDEAAAREEWRGSEPPAKPEASGHTLPASEDQDEEAGGGADAQANPLSTIRPPD